MDRIADGPYGLMVVATDVTLLSRTRRSVPAVRWNAATLLLHLLGHVFGARHDAAEGRVMAPFAFDSTRRETPTFDADTGAYLHRIAQGRPERASSRSRLGRFAFHVRTAVRNPGRVLDALGDSHL